MVETLERLSRDTDKLLAMNMQWTKLTYFSPSIHYNFKDYIFRVMGVVYDRDSPEFRHALELAKTFEGLTKIGN